MTTVTERQVLADAGHRLPHRRLLVTMQDPDTRSYRPVGFLDDLADGGFRFAYLRREVERAGFRPLIGLPCVDVSVHSPSLFPIFADRTISARRGDRGTTMAAMGLPPDARPFEVLTRSGGRRVGDLLEVVEVPQLDACGRIRMPFLVHGIRHQPPEVHQAIDRLGAGDLLAPLPEDDNAMDLQAVAVMRQHPHLRLGYAPRPLAPVVRDVMCDVDHRLTVLRRNQRSTGFHLRLLVQLEGRLATEPFVGPDWETV